MTLYIVFPCRGSPRELFTNPMDVSEKVRAFVTSNFYVPDPVSLRDDASLIDAGIVDSTGVMEIVQFLETELGVKVADAEIVPENVDSVARISSFVKRKRSP